MKLYIYPILAFLFTFPTFAKAETNCWTLGLIEHSGKTENDPPDYMPILVLTIKKEGTSFQIIPSESVDSSLKCEAIQNKKYVNDKLEQVTYTCKDKAESVVISRYQTKFPSPTDASSKLFQISKLLSEETKNKPLKLFCREK